MALPALPRRYHAASIWALYALGFVPAAWGFYLGATGQIPGNAIKEFEHLLGTWALKFLIATLAITPVRDLLGINWVRYRRALGLMTFWYVTMHFTAYMVLDQYLNLSAVLIDIVKRPFITIGMAGLTLLIPLALTSNAWSIRRLGSNWGRLHRLVYVVALAGALHSALSVKVIGVSLWLHIAALLLLLSYRVARPWLRARRRRGGGAAQPAMRSRQVG
jgi:Predicted membrane protein